MLWIACGCRPGQTRIRCGYCDGVNLVLNPDTTTHYSITAQISAQSAREMAEAMVTSARYAAKTLKTECVFQPAELVYIPYYEVSGLRLSRTKVDKMVLDQWKYMPNAGRENAEVDLERKKPRIKTDTRITISDFRFCGLAAGIKNWGMESFNFSKAGKDEQVFRTAFDIRKLQKHGAVIQPTRSRRRFQSRYVPVRSTKHENITEIVGQEVSVVYYPFYRVVYQYRNTQYQVILDGVSGKVVYCRTPVDARRRALNILMGIGSLGFFFGTFIHYNIHGTRSIGLNAVGLLFLFFLLYFGFIYGASTWNMIRYPAEIVYSGGRSTIEYIGKTGRTLPEKVRDARLDILTLGGE